jgi:hypothetical protein
LSFVRKNSGFRRTESAGRTASEDVILVNPAEVAQVHQ